MHRCGTLIIIVVISLLQTAANKRIVLIVVITAVVIILLLLALLILICCLCRRRRKKVVEVKADKEAAKNKIVYVKAPGGKSAASLPLAAKRFKPQPASALTDSDLLRKKTPNEMPPTIATTTTASVDRTQSPKRIQNLTQIVEAAAQAVSEAPVDGSKGDGYPRDFLVTPRVGLLKSPTLGQPAGQDLVTPTVPDIVIAAEIADQVTGLYFTSIYYFL